MTKPTKTVICAGGCDEEGTKPKCGKCGIPQEIELTDTEIAQLEADRLAAETRKAEEEEAAKVLADLKTSAKAKLIAGEPLTEEEASVLVI